MSTSSRCKRSALMRLVAVCLFAVAFCAGCRKKSGSADHKSLAAPAQESPQAGVIAVAAAIISDLDTNLSAAALTTPDQNAAIEASAHADVLVVAGSIAVATPASLDDVSAVEYAAAPVISGAVKSPSRSSFKESGKIERWSVLRLLCLNHRRRCKRCARALVSQRRPA